MTPTSAQGSAGRTAFPLRVSRDGRFLEDQNGVPFLIHGDTPWSLTHNLSYQEAARYMEDRRAKGFNALIVSIPDAYGPDGSHLDPPDRMGNLPFHDRDLTRPVEPYWTHVDRVLTRAEELGFLILLFPAYLGCCEDGYLQLLTENGTARAESYGRWIGTRCRNHQNVIWVHGGDRDTGEANGLVAAVRRGIQETHPEGLHTVHWAPESKPWEPFGEGWLDLYSVYTYGPVAAEVTAAYGHRPVKPVFLIETHYENDFGGRSADDTRKYPYRAVFSGAAGHFFGNRPLWFCGYGWETALDSEGARYIRIAGELLRSLPWHRLIPDQAHRFVVEGYGDPGSDDGVQSAVSMDGDVAVAYLPSVRTLSVDLAVLSHAAVKVWWFNPRTGAGEQETTFATGEIRILRPPGEGDWVLVAETKR